MFLGKPRAGVPPLIFGFLAAPGGVYYWGIGALLVPYLMRKYGVPVDRISEVVAVATLPTLWFFLVSPVIDLGLRRRDWVILFSILAAVAGGSAIMNVQGSLLWLTVILLTGHITSSLVGAAAGALMSTVPPQERGQAAGWYQAGNIGGGSLTGGFLIWLADRVPLPMLAAVAAAAVLLPALAVFWIEEKPLPHLTAGPLFRAVFRDLSDLITARRTWLGLCYFLSPVNAGALGNLISSVGPDYHASSSVVALVTGAGASVLMGLGCALGG